MVIMNEPRDFNETFAARDIDEDETASSPERSPEKSGKQDLLKMHTTNFFIFITILFFYVFMY